MTFNKLLLTAALGSILMGCSDTAGTTTPPPGPVADTVPPVISINGETNITLKYSSEYSDEGASAQDDRDGSVNVTVEGEVDSFVAGDYEITYSAVDQAGNRSTAVRNVTVEPEEFILTVSNFGKASLQTSMGDLTCSGAGDLCSVAIPARSQVDVTITPDTGWSFLNWKGCDTVSASTCSIVVEQNTLVYSTSQSDDPLVLKSDVVELSEAQIDSIQRYNTDSNSILFGAGSDLTNISVGSVIISKGTASNEFYFMRRVTDILTLQNAPTILETIPVSLDDVVSSGSVVFSPGSQSAQQQKNNWVATGMGRLEITDLKMIPGVRAKIDKSRSVPSLKIDFNEVELYDGNRGDVNATGSIDFDLDPEIAADWDLVDGLQSFRFAVVGDTKSQFTVDITGEIGDFEKEIKLGSARIAAFTVGPLIFTGNIDFLLTGEGEFAVAVSPTINYNYRTTSGVQWHRDSGWTNLSTRVGSFSVDLAETIADRLTIEVGGFADFAIKLYDIAGPFVQVGVAGELETKATPFATCPWVVETAANFVVNAGGEIEIFKNSHKVDVSPLKVKLFGKTIPEVCEEDEEPPSPPDTTLVETVSSSQLLVSWDEALDNVGVTEYEIWRRDNNGGRARRIDTTASFSLLDSNLDAEREYCYYVIALDAAENRSPVPSNLSCATTLPEQDMEPPTIPGNVIAEAISTTAIEVSWEASTDNEGVDGYVLYDYTNGEAASYVVQSVTDTSAIVTGLNEETEYCFAVSATDQRSNLSEVSMQACATTFPAEDAEWTAFLGCQGRPFLLEEKIDLNLEISSTVDVAGAGFDYPGTPLNYILSGLYNADSQNLSAEIFWSFQNSSNTRLDRFTANLSSGDSGIVPMQQIRRTGCDAQIQIVRSDMSSDVDVVSGKFTADGPAFLER